MRREELLTERLKRYSTSEAAAFHMPGHKRQMEYGLLRDFPNPFSIDITEIDGFDNLHHPEGILKDSMEWAAGVYGADHTYYLVNGSTCGILSAIGAVMRSGETLLVSRNCHKSVYHGLILNSLKQEYVYPQIIEELGIQGGIRPEDVEKKLKEHPEIRGVLIVSPTYDGVVSDIRGIAEVVHTHGIPLIVDEAHGAHFPFGAGCFPESALYCGVDLVIQSLHKTLPSLTQTALLHLNGNLVSRGRLERCLQMYQSSSPSYVFMAVMEQCIFEMQQHGTELMTAFAERVRKVRDRLKEMQNLKLLDRSQKGAHGVFDVDESKLVISCRGVMTGENLSECLRRDYAIEMEMCGADYAVAILTFLDSEEHLNRLVEALLVIDRMAGAAKECLNAANRKFPGGNNDDSWNVQNGKCVGAIEKAQQEKLISETGTVQEHPKIYAVGTDVPTIQEAEICMTPAEAFNAPLERVRLEESAGRISGEFIYLYPPGIPIITPGERMTEVIIRQVLYDRDIGLPVQGMEDQQIRYLLVVKVDEKK